jgi:1-acyl-sn-glycerol-3-phosphate acyltransferase
MDNGSVSLDHAHQTLQAGRSIVIFIEGQISPPDGSFWPARIGAARLALRGHVPVVPVGIFLRRELGIRIKSKVGGKHSEGYWYLHGPYAMTLGESILFEDDFEDRQNVRYISEAIMHQIRLLVHESENRIRNLKPVLV